MEAILEMKNIVKTFPGVKALSGVDISLNEGEILAIVGENGAGKSTLMKVLSGVYPRAEYTGDILLDGKLAEFRNTKDSKDCGIQMIPQEVSLVLNMTVAENIGIESLPANGGIVDFKKLNEKARTLLETVGLDIDPARKVRGLSTSQQQMISIAKALNANPKILVLDEPTSALTLGETEKLFAVLRSLREKGVSSIYISHKLEEVFDIADRITIMRDGRTTGTLNSKAEFDIDTVISLMVGRSITNRFPGKQHVPTDETVFQVENLSVPHRFIPGKNIIEDVNFSVKKGEIFGIAGLVGSGRSESVNSIVGMLKKGEGTKIYLDGKPVQIRNPKEAKDLGIALIGEDRRANGFVNSMKIRENITMVHLKDLFPRGLIQRKRETEVADDMKQKLSIKAPSVETKVRTLSGGNQQKVVVGKWLVETPRVLIMDEPTRGIDVGAKYEIYTIMRDLAAQGVSIIMISSELVEIIGLCDRVLVVGSGHPVGILEGKDINEETIMKLATTG